MRWLDFLEKRLGFLTIPQFPLFITVANGLIYLLNLVDPTFVRQLTLDPVAIRAGEWWRVATFLFVPSQSNPLFLVFWLLVLYQVAQALETAWGEFRFLVFYGVGAVVTVLAALYVLQSPIGNTSLNTSLFLAFATLYPDFEFLIFPLPFPIKVKYMATFAWILIALSFILGNFAARVAIGSSLTNYFLFFGTDIWRLARLKLAVYRNRRRMKP